MKNLKIKLLFSVFCFVVLATTLVSCKSASVVPPTTTETNTTKTVTVTLHDTILSTTKDSSYYKAYLECVNGKVTFNKNYKVESRKGNHLSPPKVNIKDNILEVDCNAEAQKLFAQWKEKYVLEHKDVTIRIPYPVEKQLTWWEKTRLTLGSIFSILLILFAIVVALRLTKII